MLVIIWANDGSKEIEQFAATSDLWIIRSSENENSLRRLPSSGGNQFHATIGDYPHLLSDLEKLETLLDEAIEHHPDVEEVVLVGYPDLEDGDRALAALRFMPTHTENRLRRYSLQR